MRKRSVRRHKLTMKQKQFCDEYVKCKVGTVAYKATYNTKGTPSVVQQESNKLLKKPHVQERIARLLKKSETRAILTANEILEQLSLLAQSAKQPRDKMKALELLGKYRKLFTEKLEVKGADGTALVVASLSQRLKEARERANTRTASEARADVKLN